MLFRSVFSAAREAVRKAIAADPAQPEAYNLLGALLEIKDERIEAQRFYRAALDIDPSFKPARANLDRITSWEKKGRIDLGPDSKTADLPDEGIEDGADEE